MEDRQSEMRPVDPSSRVRWATILVVLVAWGVGTCLRMSLGQPFPASKQDNRIAAGCFLSAYWTYRLLIRRNSGIALILMGLLIVVGVRRTSFIEAVAVALGCAVVVSLFDLWQKRRMRKWAAARTRSPSAPVTESEAGTL